MPKKQDDKDAKIAKIYECWDKLSPSEKKKIIEWSKKLQAAFIKKDNKAIAELAFGNKKPREAVNKGKCR